ncbi:hypothetical protein [Piscinibacter sp. HJYY11]|uniref:hypothetical protein n=1 Tax=Piscinibacter sp. HJYY11 TaxID=2801333 RepID=UPI0019202662|nr:hypothetical protein [Piscinibacter sp. HJYY11]MBL0730537.1 hypothetical protein [Piscinibacter sp. HJYY11]
MAKVWKVLALLVVVTALVWLTTLWRWQSGHVDPSPVQLLTHLVLLPMVLTLALIAMVWGVKRLRAYAAAPVVAATPKVTAQPTAALAAAATPLTSQVLAVAVKVRAGAEWKAAQSSIASGDCKIELDKQMRDDDGIAIFTAAMGDLSTDGMAETLEGLAGSKLHGLPQDWAGDTQFAEMQRALTLLEAAVDDMLDSVEAQWPALAVPLPAARSQATAAVLPPAVSIRVGIPSLWPLSAQQLAGAWLAQHFEAHIEAGLAAAGQSRAMASTARAAVQLHVHPVDSAEAFWLLMEQQLHQWQRERQPGLLWALAADSLVGESTVTSLTHANELFSGRRQQGRVPGEAAAGLLIATPNWPAPPEVKPLATLYKASLAKRYKSADASGRITPQTMVQSVTDTLQGSGLDAAQVQHLTTDADHRVSRTAEVFETVQQLLPHLDAGEHVLRLGVGCGDVGIARLVACAALTATQVQASEAPALLLGAHSPFERLAVLMTPALPTPAPAPAAAPAAAQAA